MNVVILMFVKILKKQCGINYDCSTSFFFLFACNSDTHSGKQFPPKMLIKSTQICK